MGINLPNPRSVFIPVLPPSFSSLADVYTYIDRLKNALEKEFTKAFDNTYSVVSTGTSGTFVDSNGNTITVVNGIITSLV